jgi:hypothetical protein
VSIRLRIARFSCILLHRGHDPLPVAPVRHIGLGEGVMVASGSAKTVCRRCWTVLETDD